MSRAVPSRDDEQLDAVAAGTFDDPFAILGRHEVRRSGRPAVVVRTMQPAASQVELWKSQSERTVQHPPEGNTPADRVASFLARQMGVDLVEGRDLVGLRRGGLARGLRVGVTGHREYNPAWHTALDLDNLLTVSEAVALAALASRRRRGETVAGGAAPLPSRFQSGARPLYPPACLSPTTQTW